MEYKDRMLKCIDCGTDFVFSAGEQLFYAGKGFKNEPKRCKSCKTKKASTPGSTLQQNHFSARAVTTTVCSQCGKETTVPFKVTQGRPVYCRECFQQRRAAGVS